MIHTVKTNDSIPSGKKSINELKRHPKAVTFENPAENGEIPEGYKSGDEFWDKMDKKIDEICKENGLL